MVQIKHLVKNDNYNEAKDIKIALDLTPWTDKLGIYTIKGIEGGPGSENLNFSVILENSKGEQLGLNVSKLNFLNWEVYQDESNTTSPN